MLTGIVKTWNLFRRTVRGVDSSRQLALGVTLGMSVGLLPKDSLFAYGFGVILFLSTANLLCGAISGITFSWIGAALDPITHSLGKQVLNFEPLQTTWAWLYQLPVVPWTRFENTVVTGSFVLSLMLAIPLYFVSRFCFDRYGAAIQRRFTSSRLIRRLSGSPAQRLQET